MMQQQQQTLGEMTLEEFLLKAGIAREEEFHQQKQQQQQNLEDMTLEEFLLKAGVTREEEFHQEKQQQQKLGEMTPEEYLLKAGVVREEFHHQQQQQQQHQHQHQQQHQHQHQQQHQQQQKLGEMTPEEYLLKAGVVREEFHQQQQQHQHQHQHQQNLGDMTLDEFLVRAGIIREELHQQLAVSVQKRIEPVGSEILTPGFDSTTCRSVYVGNIHLQVTEALLHEIFQFAGLVEGCKLIRKEKSSFAFIDYFEHISAGRAILILNGKHLFGQPLKVNWTYASGQREDTSDESKPEIPSSNVNIQLVQGKTDNNRIIDSDGSQFSNTCAKWSSLKVRYSDIMDATNGLSESSKIGKGGYGSVYKGKLGTTMVAIKTLDSTSKQGENEFLQELEVLYQIRHPNLVNLIGACFEVRALVYELLPNGSLEDCLEYSPNILTWQMRIRIIYEICSALIYLHSRSVVHGDLKPANILLDANFKSKISDFGLCRFLPEDMTSAVYLETVPKGTSGYIDPWFLETWILRPGSDLYSFGITILKLLTRLPPVGLGVKARDANENLFRKMIDPIAGSWPFELAKELLYWSLQCCYHNEKSSELLEDMSTCLKEMLTEIETLEEGRFKAVVRRRKTDENSLMAEEMKEEKPEVEEKKEEHMVIAVVMKVHMHCEDCAQEIKKRILRMKGVKAVEPKLKASLVTVKGVFDQWELVEYVHHMSGGTHVTIVKVELAAKKPGENKGKEEEKTEDEKNDGDAKEYNEELSPEDLKFEELTIEQKRNEFYYHPEYASANRSGAGWGIKRGSPP